MVNKTVIVDQYRAAAHQVANNNAYKGFKIHAMPGLHEFVATKAIKHFIKGATVLDLAAGSGAMCLRLHDLGFAPTAVDYVSENFRANHIPFTQADLNQDFSGLFPHTFCAVIALEIIEHLENPRHFARECFKLLKPGGRLILTTPNVDSPESKAAFLRTGQFLWFSDNDYLVEGHITPLTQWQLYKCFSEAGFHFLWTGSYGEGSRLLVSSPRLTLLSKLISLVSGTGPGLTGEVLVFVVEKSL